MVKLAERSNVVAPQVKKLLREGREDPDQLWDRAAAELNWFEP